MPEILSILFAAFILVALFKLFFDDLEDCWTSVKHFCWWFTFEIILEWSPETDFTGWRFICWLLIGALGGFLLYGNLTK